MPGSVRISRAPVGALDLAAQVGDVRAQRRDVVDVRGCPTPGRAARSASAAGRGWVISVRSRSNSIGVRCTSSPSRRTAWAARSSSSPSTASDRLVAGGRGAAQRGLQARDQLARAERLGHVVVGARLAARGPSAPPRRSPTGRGSAATTTRAARASPRCRRRRAARGRGSRRAAAARRRRRAPRRRSWPARRRSRPRAARPAARAGSAARRRRRGRAAALAHALAPAAGTSCRACWLDRELDDEARARPGDDSTQTLPPLASTNPRTIARPRPGAAMARGLARPAVERLEHALAAASAGSPARGRRPGPRSGSAAATRARAPGARPSGAAQFSSRFANARSSWAASARISGRSRRDLQVVLAVATFSAADEMTSPTSHQSSRGSAAFASSRLRSSRLSISRESRSASSRDDRGQLAPLGVVQAGRRRAARRPSRIAVSGERRSWRDRAQQRGLHDVAAPQRRRLDAAAEQLVALDRRRQQRLERRARRARAGGVSVASRQVGRDERACRGGGRPRTAGTRRRCRRRRRSAQLDRRAAAGRASRASRRGDVGQRAVEVVASAAAARAMSAARSASRRRCSASSARRRAPLGELARRRSRPRRRPPSATQFSASATWKRPVGGMWKKLNASALREAVSDAEPHAPQRRDQQHAEQVDDAERDRPAPSP